MVGPDTRLFAGVVIQMFFSAGYMLLSPIAFYITDWRHLQMVLTIIGVVFFSYWWYVLYRVFQKCSAKLCNP